MSPNIALEIIGKSGLIQLVFRAFEIKNDKFYETKISNVIQ